MLVGVVKVVNMQLVQYIFAYLQQYRYVNIITYVQFGYIHLPKIAPELSVYIPYVGTQT